MGNQVLTDCKFWLGKYDLAGFTNRFNYDAGRDLIPNDVFGNTGKSRKAGLHKIEAQLEGFFNNTEPLNEALYTPFTTLAVPITFSPFGTIDGLSYSFDCQGAEYTLGGAIGDMLKYTVKIEGANAPLHRGTLMINGIHIVSAASSILDLGTVEDATKTMHAYLHFTDAGAAGDTLDVIVESDTLVSFATPTTQITFTQVKDGLETYEHLTKVGPLADIADTFWRVSFMIGGAPATFTFVVALAIAVNTI